MSIHPKVSIIIPCYNNGKYLTKMLDCFMGQTTPFWEIIIVDDGSTDNTPLLIAEYSQKDSRIRFFARNRQPKGSVVCRNIGFEKASGEYICHLDADDLVSDRFVENRIGFMERHPELDYASFCAKTFIDDQELPDYNVKVKTYGVSVNTKDLLEDFLTANYSFSVWNNIYRKEAIMSSPWDEKVKIYTDFSFIVPGILKGLKHAFSDIQEVDYFYRTFPNKKKSINMCSNFVSDEKCESTLYLFEKTLTQLQCREDYDHRKGQFLKFIILNFQRLLIEKNFNQAEKYIELVDRYYSDCIRERFSKILFDCKKSENSKLFPIKLYWLLVTKFNDKRFRKPLIHSIAKLCLNK